MATLSTEEQKISPMMAQWHACKEKAKDAVLLFRMGDFYEAFYEDAELLSKEIELTLTKRQEIPMAGIPFHTAEGYIDRLVSKGFRVAVAEQMEDPKMAKGLVKRDVVRIVTPGTVISSSLLSEKSNNFFASVGCEGETYGLALIDVTTGQFYVTEFETASELADELFRIQPKECLVAEKFMDKHPSLAELLKDLSSCLITKQPEWLFDPRTAYSYLTAHFNVLGLSGFGLRNESASVGTAGALLKYLRDSLSIPTRQIQELHTYSTSQFMSLDRTTLKNLELLASLQDGNKKNSLLDVLDFTVTPMGGRQIQQWIKQPLLSIEEIKARQDAIEALLKQKESLELIQNTLSNVRDIERLIIKITSGYAGPKDIAALHASFNHIPSLKKMASHIRSEWMGEKAASIHELSEMNAKIHAALASDPPFRIGEGKTFKTGYHQELDELRNLSQDGQAWMTRYQADLREETGIKTLKVGFNRMFGYYIEVSRGQSDKMPPSFIRRQTLVNAERFISPVLKEYESKVLTAQERIEAIESELFIELKNDIAAYTKEILATGRALATIDALSSLAKAAKENNYSRPQVDLSNELEIIQGRHPIIERCYKRENFIPNSTCFTKEDKRLLVITGPNMAGKSTYLRQTALIAIMAQIGSFVPAEKARIGLIDKVFTRIGASDDLSKGQSTFMVEMTESANILHNATSRSLVILDEIGRGTSTYDGIAIAWSIAEYLLTHDKKVAKTLFATHYWELTKLEGLLEGAFNLHVAVHEDERGIVFLRKILPGSTNKSYGIHVAHLAGMPKEVVARANDILKELEETSGQNAAFRPPQPRKKQKSESSTNGQLSLFDTLFKNSQ